jgi:biotin carboxyl carrier protein
MKHRFSVDLNGTEREVTVEVLESGRYRVGYNGRSRVFDARRIHGGAHAATWQLLSDGGGAATLVDVDGLAPDLTITLEGVSAPVKLVDARSKVASAAAARPAHAGPLAVRSPMPGKVVKVLVTVGEEVKSGAPVAVVEAMKMENELRAPRDGKVRDISAKEGQAVEAGQALVTLE